VIESKKHSTADTKEKKTNPPPKHPKEKTETDINKGPKESKRTPLETRPGWTWGNGKPSSHRGTTALLGRTVRRRMRAAPTLGRGGGGTREEGEKKELCVAHLWGRARGTSPEDKDGLGCLSWRIPGPSNRQPQEKVLFSLSKKKKRRFGATQMSKIKIKGVSGDAVKKQYPPRNSTVVDRRLLKFLS